ncbi:MAG: polyribonucleotide nucleotidyltransferase [Candidatus Marinimicrobia bacterium]|nr:polyribonucleotide nucleotidyltransferase [Candidatus Neomarinimicrobiota bacterium]
MSIKKSSIDIAGKKLTVETGVLAKQSSGAVTVRYGDTLVLCTANSANEPKEGINFFPLQVEYREKFYGAGKIPGGYFKREARPSEKEILSARLTDRPIRPLFPKEFKCETQVIINLLSSDQENPGDILGTLGASIALMISDIPWNGPIASLRLGFIDGKTVVNPTFEELEKSTLDLVMTGTSDSIIMMEAESKEISEEDLLTAVQYGHEVIKDLIDFQIDFIKDISKEKRVVEADEIEKKLITFIKPKVTKELKIIFKDLPDSRRTLVSKLKENISNDVKDKFSDLDSDQLKKYIKNSISFIDDSFKNEIRRLLSEDNVRSDGRNLDEIRPISMQQNIIPRSHGSALFTRGQTQSLGVVTLGTKSDEQFIDDLEQDFKKTYMLHYNFPPFSVGEVGRMMGVSRREVGHGNLAERALRYVLPSHKDFPYTVRIVSEILESNGSSSMATICSGSLALMNAGVPIKSHVAGISVGLIQNEKKSVTFIDILGSEDHYGDMDFKIAGTNEGITAIQVDLKISGLSIDLIKETLDKAKIGRLHILELMNNEIQNPNENLSIHAPKIEQIQVDPSKIGAIIGPSGKTIKAIQSDYECDVEIDDSGIVIVSSKNQQNNTKAKNIIESIIRDPEVGMIFEGEVKRVMNFGAFIEFSPGREALCHISELAYQRTNKVEDVLNIGDKVKVKIINVDDMKRIDVSLKALEKPPEGWVEPPKKDKKKNQNFGNRRKPNFNK